ncbi:MAG: hypothetical protein CMF72_17735 [Mameliella sp.]|nr:hypothetical protein [Mameliella sp.]
MSRTCTATEFERCQDGLPEQFVTGDIGQRRARSMPPFSKVTGCDTVTLAIVPDAPQSFDPYLGTYEAMALARVAREPLRFENCADGTGLTSFRMNLMRKGQRITDPFTSTAFLHPTGEGWQMSANLNVRDHHAWTGRHPKNTGE